MRHLTFYAIPVLAALTVLLTACTDTKHETEQVDTVRRLATPAPATAASPEARFGFRSSGAAGMMGAGATPQFAFTTPPGWQKLPASSTRQANLQVAGDPNAECYFSVLSGTGGGLTANVNRWRKQMDLPDLSEEEVAELPQRELLGREAVYVRFDGAYSGMGDEPKENYRLIGLIAQGAHNAYFVKMTGPAPVLAGQEENFEIFAASLEESASIDPHAGLGDPHAGVAGMSGAAGPSRWAWQAPEGWTQAADRPMRVVTYTSGPNNENEIYVTQLAGVAGGVEANLNRWRQQMAQPPLSAEQIANLPKIDVLGQEVSMVSIDGTFTDDMRGGTYPQYTMYGVVIPGGDFALFVKMTGPQALMEAERENFIAFSESLTEAE
jgi:hypothetical protein